jgi:hypothetical protein
MLEATSSEPPFATEFQYPLFLFGKYLPTGRRLGPPAQFAQTVKTVRLKPPNPLAKRWPGDSATPTSESGVARGQIHLHPGQSGLFFVVHNTILK